MQTMFRVTLIGVLALVPFGLACAQEAEQTAAPAPTVVPTDETTSYAVGFQVGSNLAAGGLQLDQASLIEGLKAGISGAEPRIDEEQMQQALMELQQRAMQVQRERAAAEAEVTRRAGAAFLEINAAREGVTSLPSGLQYEVLQKGTGASPGADDRVTVHYRGALTDGTVFDSSYDRGQPATFPVGGVIPGFAEGLQLMQEGGKYKLFIPADLGYGDRGAGAIPPGSTLVFEIELLEVEKAPAAAPVEGAAEPE